MKNSLCKPFAYDKQRCCCTPIHSYCRLRQRSQVDSSQTTVASNTSLTNKTRIPQQRCPDAGVNEQQMRDCSIVHAHDTNSTSAALPQTQPSSAAAPATSVLALPACQVLASRLQASCGSPNDSRWRCCSCHSPHAALPSLQLQPSTHERSVPRQRLLLRCAGLTPACSTRPCSCTNAAA
jgi:hypothetical protein